MKKYTINDKEYNVSVNSCCGSNAEVTVNGVTYKVKIEDGAPASAEPVKIAPAQASAQPAKPSASFGAVKSVNSPLPGVIVSVKVKPGDIVQPGQVVAILEAMKMENEIQTEYAGTIVSVNVAQGDSILEGVPIVTIG